MSASKQEPGLGPNTALPVSRYDRAGLYLEPDVHFFPSFMIVYCHSIWSHTLPFPLCFSINWWPHFFPTVLYSSWFIIFILPLHVPFFLSVSNSSLPLAIIDFLFAPLCIHLPSFNSPSLQNIIYILFLPPLYFFIASLSSLLTLSLPHISLPTSSLSFISLVPYISPHLSASGPATPPPALNNGALLISDTRTSGKRIISNDFWEERWGCWRLPQRRRRVTSLLPMAATVDVPSQNISRIS